MIHRCFCKEYNVKIEKVKIITFAKQISEYLVKTKHEAFSVNSMLCNGIINTYSE